MANDATNTPETATPVTVMMNRNSFYLWLREIQRVPEGDTCDAPDFLIEEIAGAESPYFEVAAYLDTTEGTVIARHLRDSDQVKVTIRNDKPGPNLMRTVRDMLGEGEAA